MSDKLKPCPFCGSKGYIYGTEKRCKICCSQNCIVMPSGSNNYFTSDKMATKIWNTRAGEAEIFESLKEAHEILTLEFTGVRFEKLEGVLKKYGE